MKPLYPLILFLFTGASLSAQVGIGTTTPNPHAVLELKSPGNNQGFLVPRLTTAQRNALSLSSAESGLMIYDSDENKFYYWQATQWQPIRGGNDAALQAGAGISITGNTISVVADGDGDVTNEIQDLQLNGNTLTITNNASATAIDLSAYQGVDTDNQNLSYNASTGVLSIDDGTSATITPAGTAGGILSGTYPNPGLSTTAATGNAIVASLNNGSSTIQAARLQGSVVLETESPAAGAISGTFNTGLQVNDNAITTSKINDLAVTGAKIANGTIPSAKLTTTGVSAGTYGTATEVAQLGIDAQGRVTSVNHVTISGVAPAGAAGGILSGTYPNPGLATTAAAGNSIVNTLNNATTATISASRLESTVVLQTESATGGVISGTFATGLQINDNAVTNAKILDGAVTTTKVADASVTTAKLQDGAVTTSKIGNLQVTNNQIANATITGAKISDGSITSADLDTKLAAPGTFGTASAVPQLSVDAQGRITGVTNVTMSGVAPGGSASGDLTGTYPSPTIAGTAGPNIITAVNNAATGTIAATRLQSTVVLDSESPAVADISGNFATGLSINANAVGTPEISDGAVTTAKVADLQITTAKIANSAVTNTKIPNAEITPIKIVPSATPNQVLTTVAGATVWANLPAVSTGVTSIATGTALTGGTITTTGTIDVATNGITATHLRSDATTDANRAVTSNHIRNAAVNDTKLSTTGVTPNTYGSSTLIPIITVNAQGRVTGASTVAISGSSTEGLAETLAASPDAKGGTAHSLKSVSIGMTEGPSALNVNGSQSVSFREVSGNYTVAPDDYIIFNGPGKPATIELPKAGENPGRILIIRSTGTSTSDGILVNAAEGLDGFSQSEPLFMDVNFSNNTAYSITVLSIGTTWITIDRAIASTKQKG